MNYFKLLHNISKNNKNKDFIIIDRKKYTYNYVYEEARYIGQLLKKIKSQECKDSILIYSKNLYFQITAFLGSDFSENIPIICHYNLPIKVFKEIALKNNIRYIISDEKLDFENEYILENTLKIFEKIYLYEIETKKNDYDENICMGVLTSGSIDVPKVLYRTYESWADFFEIQNKIFKINSSSKLFISGSLSFTGNLNVLLSVLYEGGTVIAITSFAPKVWVKVIEEYLITNIYLVPSKLKVLVNALERKINSVKGIFTGSQLLFINTADKLNINFPNSEIVLYYGASELNYITYITYEEMKRRPLSVGKPFPNVKVFIKDNFIHVDTKYHVSGRYSPCSVNDVGHIDSEGYLMFEGRKDDVINKGGIKVSSLKIEDEIRKIKEVDDVVIIPYKHSTKGNEIAAFIVNNQPITKKYIIKNLKNNIMNNEIPKKIFFISNIPLNESGKMDRHKLKEYIDKQNKN